MSKIIHQIWLGTKKPPKWCMDSWEKDYIKNNPDWKYYLWTDKEVKNLNLINRKEYDSESTMRGKSDILRYELLYQYGGIYIDADSLCIDPNNSLSKLIKDKDFFACREPKNKQFIANGVIYCNKNNHMSTRYNFLNDPPEKCNIYFYVGIGLVLSLHIILTSIFVIL